MKMEALEDSIDHQSSAEDVKSKDFVDNASPISQNTELLPAPNGIDTNADKRCDTNNIQTESTISEEINSDLVNSDTLSHPTDSTKEPQTNDCPSSKTQTKSVDSQSNSKDSAGTIDNKETVAGDSVPEIPKADVDERILVKNVQPAVLTTDNIQFQTEVLVEKEETVITSDCIIAPTTENHEAINDDNDATNKILSQLEGHDMDLGEALESSSDINNCENNNGSIKQEVLNKEELLDILEGNDSDGPTEIDDDKFIEHANSLESALALQQFQELKKTKTRRHSHRTRKNKSKKLDTPISSSQEDLSKDSIINVLVKDWEDDDIVDSVDLKSKTIEKKKSKGKKHVALEEDTDDAHDALDQSPVNSALDITNENQDNNLSDVNKSLDDTLPHRRVGRVIKKKVIFDPDNPDTFTKSKNAAKVKVPQNDKEQMETKKIKEEQIQSTRPKSKSPVNKTHWKKPQLKNKNPNKRPSEVDKLLMDEGAVNMIYQLTPEASKGRKTMRTKAELIKKINQSSTPDNREMKFRERRKDTSRSEEREGIKNVDGKQRVAMLGGSVKSPSVYEDFEAHSADDSIIYRRHSSSSYSSTCLSPRRLSDVEASTARNSRVNQINADCEVVTNVETNSDIFMSEEGNVVTAEIIDKKVCLNIKEKLNSKLSSVLNTKRKREAKGGKPSKLRKSSSKATTDDENEVIPKFEKITININNKVAEITIQETKFDNNVFDTETLNELRVALTSVSNRKDISVTLLTSSCGRLCSGLNLKSLINDNLEIRKECAFKLADSVRLVLQCLHDHSKLLVAGVDGACDGLSMAMLALCDLTVASDRTIFSLVSNEAAPLSFGVSLLTHFRALPRSLVQEMVVCGRQVSAREAAPLGLVARTVPPRRYLHELRALAGDIAADSSQTLLLKKRLLCLEREVQMGTTFLKCVEAERDLFVEHWCSTQGQEMLQNYAVST